MSRVTLVLTKGNMKVFVILLVLFFQISLAMKISLIRREDGKAFLVKERNEDQAALPRDGLDYEDFMDDYGLSISSSSGSSRIRRTL